MATVWITYVWEDNEANDIDYVAQELEKVGVQVKLDKWNIQAGKRLWDQVENFIQNLNECDAWVMYATQNSLGSEPYKEEYAYALDRALNQRNEVFPIIALFPSPVENTLLPAGIKTRLYVSLIDRDWKERIKAAAENRIPSVEKPEVAPYLVKHYLPTPISPKHTFEIRPRAAVWGTFVIGVPIAEKDTAEISLTYGSSGRIPTAGITFVSQPYLSSNSEWWLIEGLQPASPVLSYYAHCINIPSRLLFGEAGGITWIMTYS